LHKIVVAFIGSNPFLQIRIILQNEMCKKPLCYNQGINIMNFLIWWLQCVFNVDGCKKIEIINCNCNFFCYNYNKNFLFVDLV